MESVKISILLVTMVCVAAVAGESMPYVIQLGSRFKVEQVSDSNLEEAFKDIISFNMMVKELDLSGNTLSKITVDDLTVFENLRVVDLSTNILTGVVDLSALPAVQSVDVNDNFVTEVLVGSAIEVLHAANNNIVKVICVEGSPKNLILANNKIRSLTDLSPSCRSGIVHLDLSLNEIDEVDFSELSESRETLRFLNLQFNSIVNVQNSADVIFSKLSLLDVSFNKLAYMGQAFQAAMNVGTLDVSNNKIVLISSNLTFNRVLSSFDLRGNGLDCGTLQKFFRKNEFLYMVSTYMLQRATGLSKESCAENVEHVGPYCCEQLPTPYVDRLVAAKRKELSLLSNPGEPKCCERELIVRRRKEESVREQYRAKTDATRRRAREELLLIQEKINLQEIQRKKHPTNEELEVLVQNTAEELSIPVATKSDSWQTIKYILQKLEETRAAEEKRYHGAVNDLEKYERYIKQLMQEKKRLQQENEQLSAAFGFWS